MWILLVLLLSLISVDCTVYAEQQKHNKCSLQLNKDYRYDLSGMFVLRTEDYTYVDDRGNTLYVNICNDASVPCDPYSPVCQLNVYGVYYSFGVLSSQIISSLNSSESGYNVQINYSGGQFCPSSNSDSGSSTIYIKCETKNSTNYGSIVSVVYSEESCHYSIYMSSVFGCALRFGEQLTQERNFLQIILPSVFGAATAIVLVVVLTAIYMKRKRNKNNNNNNNNKYSLLPVNEQ